MQPIGRDAPKGPATPSSAREAIDLIEQTLDEEYGATADPDPDDLLHSELDLPPINRLRQVIAFLRMLPIPLTMTLIPFEPWITNAGLRLSGAFFVA